MMTGHKYKYIPRQTIYTKYTLTHFQKKKNHISNICNTYTHTGSIDELATSIETSSKPTATSTAISINAEYSTVNGDKIDEHIDNNRTTNKSTNVILLKKEPTTTAMPIANASQTAAVVECQSAMEQHQHTKDEHKTIVDKSNANDIDNKNDCMKSASADGSCHNQNDTNFKIVNSKDAMELCDANRNDDNSMGRSSSLEISKYICTRTSFRNNVDCIE